MKHTSLSSHISYNLNLYQFPRINRKHSNPLPSQVYRWSLQFIIHLSSTLVPHIRIGKNASARPVKWHLSRHAIIQGCQWWWRNDSDTHKSLDAPSVSPDLQAPKAQLIVWRLTNITLYLYERACPVNIWTCAPPLNVTNFPRKFQRSR
jgi:hypothetical protein